MGAAAVTPRRPALRLGGIATTWLMVAAVAAAGLTVAARVAGVRPLVEQSGSMQPALEPGDLLLSRSVPAASLRPGDIVTFSDADRGGRLITHRVTAVRRAGDTLHVETRGDANATGEQWTAPAHARLGRTFAALPYAGRVIDAVGRPLVAGCLAAMIATLLTFSAARRYQRRDRWHVRPGR